MKSVDLKLREITSLILLPLKVLKKIVVLLIVSTKALREKLGRLESFKMTSLDRRNVGIQYSDGTLFIYFILSFTSVYSFIGLFDAYPIVEIKPV